MSYSPERREAVLKKMLPPDQRSIPDIAREEGIAEPTLYAWRTRARNEGRLMPDSNNTPQGWSSRDKFTAVLETASLSEAEIAEYCRGKGLHTSQIKAWREACMQANDWDRESSAQLKSATKAADKRTKQLERELLRKDKALAETAALLVLRGKLNALFGEDEDV